jgi:hypothetical protein
MPLLTVLHQGLATGQEANWIPTIAGNDGLSVQNNDANYVASGNGFLGNPKNAFDWFIDVTTFPLWTNDGTLVPGFCLINSIVLHIIHANLDGANNLTVWSGVGTGGGGFATDAYDQNNTGFGTSLLAAGSGYQEYTRTFLVNPVTGVAWVPGDLFNGVAPPATQAFFFDKFRQVVYPNYSNYRINQVYLVVDYTPVVPPVTTVTITQLPIEIVYPFAFVADQETDAWAPATEDGSAGSAVSGPALNANVGGCLPLQDFIDALAARLTDSTHVHWTTVELTRYIIEALRTYNAFSQSLRNRGVFLSAANAPFYDLPTVLPSLRGYTVTDLDLILDVEYALMEPPALGTWAGSSQFTLADLVAAIERRRDLFLRETGAVLTREVRTVTPPVSGRITFPDDVITIRRAAWISAASVVTPLQRDDEWGMNKYLPTWPQQSVNPAGTWPTAFSLGVTPPLTMQMAPPITDAGSIDLLSVLLGADLGSNAPGVLLGVPDDWTWVIKFGALSDLLSQQGVAFDPARAAYCEARWRQGIQMATAATVVLAAQINGEVVPISSVSESDKYDTTWQTTPGEPTRVLIDGQNIVGLSPLPDAGLSSAGYTVTLDLVVNFPVPLNTTDCVDVDKSVMEIVIDYAQHLALFKEGPGLVQQSMALYEKFERACGVTVELDTASVPTRGALFQQTVQDPRIVPRRSPVDPQEPE